MATVKVTITVFEEGMDKVLDTLWVSDTLPSSPDVISSGEGSAELLECAVESSLNVVRWREGTP